MLSQSSEKQASCKLLQLSVVVAGAVHNPSILNPDFLELRGIVPKEWNWERASGSITTPPFALVRFKNGVAITVEHEKLQVVDDSCDNPRDTKSAYIAMQYVKTLPHVHFTGVGINFQTAMQVQDPPQFIKERFLKTGAWDTPERSAKAVGLRFVYPEDSGKVLISVDPGESGESTDPKSPRSQVAVVNANFHVDCPEYPSDEFVIQALGRLDERWGTFVKLFEAIVGVKWT
jgi:hypothetical protein